MHDPKQKSPFLSVIIPIFNEEKRIKNIPLIVDYLIKKKFKWEIVIINDGSTDTTLKKLGQIKANNISILSYIPNKGKGYAVKQGMLHSRGHYKLFIDIDLSTPMDEFDKFLPNLNKYDVIIGSRRVTGSKFLTRQPYLREFMGRVFTELSQIFTGVSVADFTCGFKCFSKKSAKMIFSKQLIDRWGFDAEVLFLAKLYGFPIKEVPVSWRNDSGSKVRFPQDIITSCFDLFRIRINLNNNKYG